MLMSGVSGLKLYILIEPKGSIIDARITTVSVHDSKAHTIFIPKYSSSIFTPIRKNMTSKELTKIELKSYFYFTKVNRWLFVSLYKMFVHVSGEIRYLSCD